MEMSLNASNSDLNGSQINDDIAILVSKNDDRRQSNLEGTKA